MIEGKQYPKMRIMFLLVVLVVSYLGLGFRVLVLHTLKDERLSKLSDSQFDYKIKLTSQRGRILDRNQKVLAMSIKVPSVYIDPSMFKPSEKEINHLSNLLSVPKSEIIQKMRSKTRRFAWLKRYADPEIEDLLKSIDIYGMNFIYEWKRFYPDRELASQVIGFVGVDGNGIEGVEREFDQTLRGTDFVIYAQKDARGRAIYLDPSNIQEPEPGRDVVLTIDASIQYLLEKEMTKTANENKAKSALGVIMDPNNGEILAMASYPPFNANRIKGLDPESFKNRPVQEVFEPGSTFKVFTMAAALEKKTVSTNQLYMCAEGSLKFGNKTIRNTLEKVWLTPQNILKYSNNVGAARIAMEMGAKSFYEELLRFGFGQKQFEKYPGETKGLLAHFDSWHPIDLANVSFGQGVGVTAVQMVSALSMVANGGYKVKPSIIRSANSKKHEKILSSRTVQLLKTWMISVVNEEGTGHRAYIDGYEVAGKTGTAQMLDEVGAYTHQKVTSSFMGFVPANDPKLLSIVVFREPQKVVHGGEIAAPVFKNVMLKALNYLEIMPSGQSEFVLKKHVLPTEKDNVEQSIQSDQLMDLRGLSLREVLAFEKSHDLRIESYGSGFVKSQDPSPGTKLDEVKKLKVYLSNELKEKRT